MGRLDLDIKKAKKAKSVLVGSPNKEDKFGNSSPSRAQSMKSDGITS